jgi:hypothetical protein
LCGITVDSVASAPPLTAESARAAVEARGEGKGIRVQEVDGTSVRGTIQWIGEESFMVQDGSKPPVEVPFSKVTKVQGPGLSKGAKIGIWVGVGVVVVVLVAAVVIAGSVVNNLKI